MRAIDQECVRSCHELVPLRIAATPLHVGGLRGKRGWRHRQSIAHTENQHGLVPRHVELEAPGRGEVLDVIKAPITLRGVEELAIPVRRGAIDAVAKRTD